MTDARRGKSQGQMGPQRMQIAPLCSQGEEISLASGSQLQNHFREMWERPVIAGIVRQFVK